MTTSNNVTLSPSGADIDTPVSSVPTTPSAISVDSLGQSTPTPPSVPASPAPSDLTSVVTSGTSAINGNSTAITPSTSSTDTPPPTPSWLTSLMSSLSPNTNGASTYATDEENANIGGLQNKANNSQSALNDATTNLNNLNAQLKVYSDNAQAIPIADQNAVKGEGVTTAGLAPIDSANLRNNALAAIPLQAAVLGAQAQVATAQGNATLAANILAQAQAQVDKVFSIQQTDATNQFNYNQSVISTYYNYATTEQQDQLDALKTTQAQQYQTQQNNLNAGQSMAATAIASGQADIAGKITALDPTSPTYTADLGKLEAQIVPKSTTETWGAPYTLNGQTVQQSSTGEIKTVGSSTSAPAQSDVIAGINQLINTPYNVSNATVNGKYDPSLDVKYTDQNGYLTAQGFTTLVQTAQENGMTRAQFLQEFGSDLNPKALKDYQLTTAEVTALNK